MAILDIIREKILDASVALSKEHAWGDVNYEHINAEIPVNLSHGDVATNAAMVIAKSASKPPQEIANLIKDRLSEDDIFQNINVVAPGFINFVLKDHVWHEELARINTENTRYGKLDLGLGKKVNLEFVSTNPTGPMHVAHARGAIYGDALARILAFVGYDVTKEFYVNDAGGQVLKLAQSVYFRYLELFGKADGDLPAGCYPGEYLIDVAHALKEKHQDKLLSMDEQKRIVLVRDFAVDAMMDLIKDDLKKLDVLHDVFFYESQLHKDNKLEEVVEFLKLQDDAYMGVLPPPKGHAVEDYEPKEQLLFRSTKYGDDGDRTLQKSNGQWTYFAGDVAYMQNKLERGFDHLIIALGADHIGHKKKFEAAYEALNKGSCVLSIRLCQIVTLLKDGQAFKMSKRSGNIVAISDVLEVLDRDVLRFMMLTRKNDVRIEFDVEKAQEQSKDNPVFYVQYANTRACSVLNKAEGEFVLNSKTLQLLKTEDELQLIKLLSYFPRQIFLSATHHEPHRINYYLQHVAKEFHAFWNKGKDSQDLRFIVEGNLELTNARLALVTAVKIVLSQGLHILGIKAMNTM